MATIREMQKELTHLRQDKSNPLRQANLEKHIIQARENKARTDEKRKCEMIRAIHYYEIFRKHHPDIIWVQRTDYYKNEIARWH